VSGPVGSRWFRERGGMPTIELGPSTGRHLWPTISGWGSDRDGRSERKYGPCRPLPS
jgi:hypothetical protein